jgi:1-deoxy-D-xylulose-5-phosphate reductoisomerase
MMQTLTILGATGSIGRSTLDVVARHPEAFAIFALTAHRQKEALFDLCLEYAPRYAVLPSAADALWLKAALSAQGQEKTEVLAGAEALSWVASTPEVDVVMAAIVGAAGLLPTLAAVRAGKRVLLANKEALVMAGALFVAAKAHSGAEILPIDSEHNAIFQCLPTGYPLVSGQVQKSLEHIWLTASGGPFRQRPLETFQSITPSEACAHPNWQMGQKISVDSATMMNKALEVIEAHWLFALPAEKIRVVLHPQSIIHSLVAYADGSVLAQLGQPDMRTPIAQALAYPARFAAGVAPLNLWELGALTFAPPDALRYPALAFAYQVLAAGGHYATVLNAANEVAVAAFLAGRLPFTGIAPLLAEVLADFAGENFGAVLDLDEILAVDAWARQQSLRFLQEE